MQLNLSLKLRATFCTESVQRQLELQGSEEMIFYSFFLNAMMGKTVTVELKNDLMVRGVLSSVDQYLNVKLDDVKTLDEETFPHLLSTNNCFIRGSVIRYIHLPKHEVNTEMLQDATRRENKDNAQ